MAVVTPRGRMDTRRNQRMRTAVGGEFAVFVILNAWPPSFHKYHINFNAIIGDL